MKVKCDITNGAREGVESLWVELQREETKGKVILVIRYRPPNLRKEGDVDLLAQLGVVARLGNVIMMGGFNYMI